MEYEQILKNMLARVPDDIDKREGSIIYNALAPAALELARMYFTLASNIDLIFADTAVEEYLDRLCNQIGLTRKDATYAIRKGVFYDAESNPFDVEIGTRYSCNSIVFAVTEKIEAGVYKMQCETAGIEGNNYVGDLIPVEYIQGLAKVTLTDILIPGENTESDDDLRTRYYELINEKAFAGNIADYKQKTKEIDGVGAVKVYPVWNGGGTVKLTILDSEYNKASDELISVVQSTIDPQSMDEGIGLAPIGHKVTVDTVEDTEINVSSTITLATNTTIASIKLQIEEVISEYLKELRQNWEDAENTVVRISQIEARILNLDGVLDITDTEINNSDANLELPITEIPVLGEVVIE